MHKQNPQQVEPSPQVSHGGGGGGGSTGGGGGGNPPPSGGGGGVYPQYAGS